jgi:hypothetical protein
MLSKFERELQESAPFISRWYPFAWLQLISDARVRKASPTVGLIGLVSALGGMARSVDPCAFGFMNLFSSVEPFAKQFEPGKYFMARGQGSVNPMIGIDFGPTAGFELETVSIETRAPVAILSMHQ